MHEVFGVVEQKALLHLALLLREVRGEEVCFLQLLQGFRLEVGLVSEVQLGAFSVTGGYSWCASAGRGP